jgi:glucose/arabinose dehydrogenase
MRSKLSNLDGVVAATAVLALVVAQSPKPLHAQAALQVIATGLDNPRGLAFGPDGALYVAEAGRGGTSALCAVDPGTGANRCYGPTGAITRITSAGVQERVVVGLPSIAPAGGDNATGPVDIDFAMGRTWLLVGFAGDPANRAPFEAAGIRLGSLVRVLPNGQWDYVADVSAHERTNPDGTTIDTNPFGLRVLSDRALVADAGANALLQIALDGTVSTLAVFPARTLASGAALQSVPTTVVQAPGGDLYVGELTGQPFPVGSARVYRVPSAGGTPVVVAGGFTNIIDIALAPNGVGYVLEHDADGIIPPLGPGVNGRIVRVDATGAQTVIASVGLVKPGGIAIGPDGALYVTTRTNFAGTGGVVRIVVP